MFWPLLGMCEAVSGTSKLAWESVPVACVMGLPISRALQLAEWQLGAVLGETAIDCLSLHFCSVSGLKGEPEEIFWGNEAFLASVESIEHTI